MGTTWSVSVCPPPGLSDSDLHAAIEAELAEAVALFSHWEPSSELSRFNAAAPGFHPVSEALGVVIAASLGVAEATDGAVDPTLGALVDLWGFGPPGPRATGDTPTEQEIDAALAVSGWERTRFDEAGALFQPGGLKLDLSGIAKGHTVDRVSRRLTALGATSHLVEIGGELIGQGVKPDGQPWWVELEPPPGFAGPRTLAALFEMAVATSGSGERVFAAGGRAYSHTLDGRTGRPITNGVASVSVFADTAMDADMLATALTVMGPVAGMPFAEERGIAALMVADGAELRTPALDAMLE